jgi:hypothetical protein
MRPSKVYAYVGRFVRRLKNHVGRHSASKLSVSCTEVKNSGHLRIPSKKKSIYERGMGVKLGLSH